MNMFPRNTRMIHPMFTKRPEWISYFGKSAIYTFFILTASEISYFPAIFSLTLLVFVYNPTAIVSMKQKTTSYLNTTVIEQSNQIFPQCVHIYISPSFIVPLC